jgi:hypothetical protein
MKTAFEYLYLEIFTCSFVGGREEKGYAPLSLMIH